MAKKKTTKSKRTTAPSNRSKKKTTKKTAKKKAASKKVAKKATTKKKTTKKKAVTKKAATKKVTKKKTTKKVTKKKAGSKKVTRRVTKPEALPTNVKAFSLEDEMEKEWTVDELKRVKTGLKKKDLAEFLKLLIEKRAEIVGNVRGMEIERNASLGDIAHMPLHMADVGSDNFDQEFTLGLMESERERLKDIEEAILRMREGYYGVCLATGKPIGHMRLEFAPWAKYCIEVARAREKRGW